MPLPYVRGLKIYARQLRTEMTDCEQILWRRIRRKQILNTQFYRQKPVGPYILDFYSNFPKLVIELDGSQHLLPEQQEKDIVRDRYLESLNVQVLRFNNLEVLKNINGVLEVVTYTINQLKKHSQ